MGHTNERAFCKNPLRYLGAQPYIFRDFNHLSIVGLLEYVVQDLLLS